MGIIKTTALNTVVSQLRQATVRYTKTKVTLPQLETLSRPRAPKSKAKDRRS
jgi:hypothetical protein